MAEIGPNGVRQIYANNGNFVTSFNDRGSRNDFSNPPHNMEATGYFSGTSDDISPKIRGGRHTDSARCDGCCYIPAFRGSGGVKYRVECPHPSYHSCSGSSVGGGPSSFSGMKGAKVIVWNTSSNCVHIELWQDSTGNAPGNWRKVFEDEDCGGKCGLSNCGGGPLLRPRGSSNQFTWRNDGNPSKKWLHLVEIQPGGSAPSPGTGIPGNGGDPNGPNGDGGGGGGDDNNTGSGGGASAFAGKGCAIATAGGNTVQAGTCGGTGEDLLPDIGGGDGIGGATEPKPIVTVFKDLALLYNIRTDLFDNCTIQGDMNVTNYEEVYSVSPEPGEYVPIFQNGIQYIGIKLHASSSALHKKRIRKVDVTMKRSEPVALDGFLRMQIRDRNGNLLEEFDTVIDAASIDLNDETYSFFHNNNTHKLEAGDMIVLSYVDGGDTVNNILVANALTGADSFDGFNTIYVESQSGIGWDTDQLNDAAFKVYT